MKTKILFCLFILLFVSTANAGSPTYVEEGKSYKWKNGEIKVYFDTGSLTGNINNAKAKEIVKEAWKKWEEAALLRAGINDKIYTSAVKFIDMGDAPEGDVNASNYEKYYAGDEAVGTGAYDKDRPTVIIFDMNGEIIKDLINNDPGFAGVDASTILGLTQIYARDHVNKYFINGTIIINGLYWESVTDQSRLKVVIMHELGHLLNLDHSGLNDECKIDPNCGGDSDGLKYLPTMYKSPASTGQESLHRDDVIWSAFLYRDDNKEIMDKFCTVWGRIYDVKGRGLQGVQVIAFEVEKNESPRTFAVSAITGVYSDPCAEDGTYILPGLRPGKTYKIDYARIPDWCGKERPCNLMSGINPYAPPRPVEEYGYIYNAETGYEFKCDAPGKVTEAVYVKLKKTDIDSAKLKDYDIPETKCTVSAGKDIADPPPPPAPASGSTDTKKGWCSLVVGAVPGFEFVLFLLPSVIIFAIRKYLHLQSL